MYKPILHYRLYIKEAVIKYKHKPHKKIIYFSLALVRREDLSLNLSRIALVISILKKTLFSNPSNVKCF